MKHLDRVSTGLGGLDEVLNYLRMGDNVVMQVDHIQNYKKFALPFVQKSIDQGRKVIYLRFAFHEPIINEQDNVVIYNIDANEGFEAFSTQIHHIIKSEGEEVFYVFDCLSELLHTWVTDLMIGNFFRITCPYLFELNTVAFFAVYKNRNSFETIAAIRDTTQVFLDIYEVNRRLYVHPLKVWNRYTTTMFLPHIQEGQDFIPLAGSCDTATLFADLKNSFENPKRYLDYWDRMFLDAADLNEKIQAGEIPPKEQKQLIEKLSRVFLSRDKKIISLLTENFSVDDLLSIKSRLIGSGFIGGKAVGMLLARKILQQDSETDWSSLLEHHDSFFVGSDVFYTYIVQNDLWKLRMKQRNPDNYLELAPVLKEKMLNGVFPQNIREQFLRMLEYFGQSPIIVRSSSLLEDGFGNAFAGKYESIFCINQGTPEQRYQQFEDTVKRVYASTMNEDALAYRVKRGLDQKDEQMALLIQRVSGSYKKQYFFPDMAGVGFSYNTYVWEKGMDPKAGMLRVVAGLGTRAVNRIAGDYARIAALDSPLLKPYAGLDDYKQFSQRELDLLNIEENLVQSVPIQMLLRQKVELPLSIIAERDYETERIIKELGRDHEDSWIITFDRLLSKTPFRESMQKMLKKLEKIYQYPVDIEFTVNFKKDETFRINLLQCRPLMVKGLKARVEVPKLIPLGKVFFHSRANFMGGNIQKNIKRVVFVDPESYCQLSESGKYEVARTVGKLNRIVNKENTPILLLGPGRWGTSTPSLGVPVNFSEINNVTVLGELAYHKTGYAPEVSFGTHFFQDLVESEIFYVALFPERADVEFQLKTFDLYGNILTDLLPEKESLRDVIKVYDLGPGVKSDQLYIAADTMEQEVKCYFA